MNRVLLVPQAAVVAHLKIDHRPLDPIAKIEHPVIGKEGERLRRLAQNFALHHIARKVGQLDLVGRLKVHVISEFPDDLFVAGDFEKLRLFSGMALAVRNNCSTFTELFGVGCFLTCVIRI